MAGVHTADALESVWAIVRRANKYIDETEPWVLAKKAGEDAEAKATLSAVMAHLAAGLRVVAAMLQPVMVDVPKAIFEQLGLTLPEGGLTLNGLAMADLPAGAKVVKKGQPIFPRLDVEEEVGFIAGLVSKDTKGKGRAVKEAAKKAEQQKEEAVEHKAAIEYDDFDKIEILAAKITAAELLPKSKKLIKFTLDDGSEKPRQILSGIRQWYPEPEVLVGKTVAIVANMKPRKMAGELSEGMVLSAEKNGIVTVSILPDSIEAGSGIE